MDIIVNELKKIFNLRSVIILMLGVLLLYTMFISDYKDFVVGIDRPFSIRTPFTVEKMLIDNYGNELDKKEFYDLEIKYNDMEKELNEFFSNNEEAKRLEITNWEEYGDPRSYYDGQENKMEFNRKLDSGEIGDKKVRTLIFDLYDLQGYMKNYEGQNIDLKRNKISILPTNLLMTYHQFITKVLIIVLLSIVFMITPIFIKDKMSKVEQIQYTSKKGRELYKGKILAALISTTAIMLIEIGICIGTFLQNGSVMFLKSNMSSFLNDYPYSVNYTFLQYIILSLSLIFLIGIGASLISIYISNKASNYVGVIGMQIPILAILMITSDLLVCIFMNDILFKAIGVYVSILIISITLLVFNWRQNKQINIEV